MQFSNKFLVFFLITLFLSSCKNDYTPKPRGYFRIDFPKKKYHVFSPEGCPFSFEIPDYTNTQRDLNSKEILCWYDINFTQFDGKIHFSYKPVNNNLNSHIEDCRTLAYKHTVKADAIDENIIYNDAGTASGLRYDIAGNAASSIQFYMTDSVKHFIRGALYFNCPPQSDSLAPVIEFCKKDIEHLIKTINWK